MNWNQAHENIHAFRMDLKKVLGFPVINSAVQNPQTPPPSWELTRKFRRIRMHDVSNGMTLSTPLSYIWQVYYVR
jgi:hypothetical protein